MQPKTQGNVAGHQGAVRAHGSVCISVGIGPAQLQSCPGELRAARLLAIQRCKKNAK